MDLVNGITGYEALRKQAAETFVSWVTNPPAPSVQYGPVSPTVDMNDAYYNPYGHPSNSTVYTDVWGQAYYGTLTGRLVDQGGNPIAGAAVHAVGWVGVDNPFLPNPSPTMYTHSGYTDDNGEFEIRAYDPAPGNPLNPNVPGEVLDKIIWDIKFGAYATAWMKKGYVGEDNAFYPFLPGATHALQSLVSQVDQVVEYAVVWSNETQNFEALASLSFENEVVGGRSDMKARYAVHWGQEFRALTGCEVHAHTAPVVFTCEDIASVNLRSTSVSFVQGPPTSFVEQDKEIELGVHTTASPPSIRIKPTWRSLRHPNRSRGLG
ncbi:MAG: carboxypeptidase regulatory-like domain-containing protein [Flavobacteriales bacterium]|nr:carboxypeptidase regulatory-like domain-containing protein [Flavobacteriales bacterium]